jgi:hypothetical protein
MGITLVALLLSAQLFNSTISENRDGLEELVARVSGHVRPLASAAGGGVSAVTQRVPFLSIFGGPLLVIGLTALIYGFADPSFGISREGLIVAISVLVCVGATTYVTEGGEAFLARSRYGQSTGIRAFPLAVGIAAVSVIFTRLAGLQPAIIYGFVGTAVFLRPSTMSIEEAGKTAFVPSLLLLCVSLSAWFLVIPLRALNEQTSATIPMLLESIAGGIFIIGLESLAFSMIPVSFMDGEKIWKWNKGIWLLMAGTATLLFWHVLLNRDAAYGDVASDGASMTVIGALAFVLAISFVTWLFFRKRPQLTA